MITIIYGPPGAGKGALQTYLIEKLYNEKGYEIWQRSCEEIDNYNFLHKRNLTKPKKVPIFSDFEVSFKVDYEKFYSTYFLNGFYFGLENEKLPVMFVPPCSQVFLSEVQRYYDSRKSYSLPDFVSRNYEMHRHFFIDLTLDLQRLSLLDLNIKDLATRVIYIKKLDIIKDFLDNVIALVWHCREFECAKDADAYIDNNVNVGKDVVFRYDRSVFENYDSFSNFEKFIPDKYHDFVYCEHNEKSVYNEIIMPEGYRIDKIKKNK